MGFVNSGITYITILGSQYASLIEFLPGIILVDKASTGSNRFCKKKTSVNKPPETGICNLRIEARLSSRSTGEEKRINEREISLAV